MAVPRGPQAEENSLKVWFTVMSNAFTRQKQKIVKPEWTQKRRDKLMKDNNCRLS